MKEVGPSKKAVPPNSGEAKVRAGKGHQRWRRSCNRGAGEQEGIPPNSEPTERQRVKRVKEKNSTPNGTGAGPPTNPEGLLSGVA